MFIYDKNKNSAMRGSLVAGGLALILSACSPVQKQESLEDLDAKAKWEIYGGKINYDKGLIEGGYFNEMHDIANLSLSMAKPAESFEYDGSAKSLESLVRYGMQSEFAANSIRSVYDERENAKGKFPVSWHERLDFSFQLVLNKFLRVYDTLDSAWKKSNKKINFRELKENDYDSYMAAKSYFSEAGLTMRAYRSLATQVKVRLPEEPSSLHQRGH